MENVLNSNKPTAGINLEDLKKEDSPDGQSRALRHSTAEERVEKLEEELEQAETEYIALFDRMKKLREGQK